MTEDENLYMRAVQIVAESHKASTSFVQRQLRIGYNSAARLIERMEAEGKLGPPDHVGRREVRMVPSLRYATPDQVASGMVEAAVEEINRPIEQVAADLVQAFGVDGAQAIVSVARAAHGEIIDPSLEQEARRLVGDRELDEHGVAHLTAIVERAESLIAERDGINQTLRDLFSFAKNIGLDPRAIRARLKERELDETVRHEREATDEVYRSALGITGPDFVIPLPRPSVEAVRKTKKITAREKQMRDALALIRADRATAIN